MAKDIRWTMSAVDKTDMAFKSVERNINKIANGFKNIIPVAAIAGFAGIPLSLGAIAREAINTGDQLNDLHERTGMAVEDLSGLGYVGKQTGSDLAGMEKGLKYLNNLMLDISRGTGTAKQTFDELGLSVTGSDGKMKDMMAIFLEASDSIAGIDDETRQAAYAMELFGARTGSELIPMLKLGSAEIKKMIDHADRLGILFGEKDAKAADAFNDSLADFKGTLSGIGREITTSVLPGLTSYMTMGTEWLADNKELVALKVEDTIERIGDGFENLAKHKDGIVAIFEAVGSASDLLLRSADGWDQIFDGFDKVSKMKPPKPSATGYGMQQGLGGGYFAARANEMKGNSNNNQGLFPGLADLWTFNYPGNLLDWNAVKKRKPTPPGRQPNPGGGGTPSLNKNADVFNDLALPNPLVFDMFGSLNKADEFHEEWNKNMDDMLSKTEDVVPSIAEKWDAAYMSIKDNMMTVDDMFESTSYGILNGWTNTLAGMTGEAYTFENVMKGIFDSILISFRNTAAQIAAERLFKESADMFGKGLNFASSVIGTKAAAPSGSFTNFPSGPAGKTIVIQVNNASNSRILSAVMEETRRHGLRID